jgi:RNA polymerase-binding protein DksA
MTLDHRQLSELESLLRKRLQSLNVDVNDRLQETNSRGLQDLNGTVGDAGDESVAHMMTDLSLTAATRDVNELREVEAALQRIADGTYGECVECGRDIGYERLKAYPTAMRCVVCQAQYEKVYAGPGTPSL